MIVTLELLQHGVFVCDNSSKQEPRRTGLNFVERIGRDAVLSLWYYDPTLDNFFVVVVSFFHF